MSDAVLGKIVGSALLLVCQVALLVYPIARRRIPGRRLTIVALRLVHWLHLLYATYLFVRFLDTQHDVELGAELTLLGFVMLGITLSILLIGSVLEAKRP